VLAVTAEQTAVLVDLDERTSCAVPDSFRERIRDFEGGDLDG
jgi:acyl-CoA thioesterase FadM